MQAVINLSGEGTKLRPLSCSKCSGMLKLGRFSIARVLIEHLKKHFIDDIIVITGYMPQFVKENLGDGRDMGVSIRYISASGGDATLKAHSDILSGEFIYFSKPVYTDMDFTKQINLHRERAAYATIVVDRGITEGIIKDKTGRVTRLEEKRLWDSLTGGETGLGIYILNRDIVRFIPEDITVELMRNVLPSLVRAGKNIYSSPVGATSEVVYDTASYMRANAAYLDYVRKQNKNGIVTEDGAKIEKGALLEAPCYIGKNAHIHKGAKIGAYSIIGNGSVVGEGASVKRSIVGEGCHIGKDGVLRGCILDDDVIFDEGVTVYEQAIIGADTRIGERSTIKSFVRIWPEKNIESGVTVSENIMWGQKKRARLFDNGVIYGIVNVDITARFCTALGECVGHVFDMGEVGISTDGTPVGAMLRDSIAAGLLGTGCHVKDFGEQPLPITRRGTAFYMLKGAVAINVSDKNGEDWAEITVIGQDGADIGDDFKSRLEEYFEKGDFMYPESKNIKECEYLFEYKLYYLKSLVNYKKHTGAGRRLLLSCSAPWGRRLIASAMADFSTPVSMYTPEVDDKKTNITPFCEAVRQGGFDIGFVLDSKCEKLTIVLPDGVVDEELYEALTSLIVMKKHKNPRIYVPVTASGVIDHLAEKYGCDVVRTKTIPREIMHTMSGEDKSLTDQYIFRFDAVGAVIRLIDFLYDENTDIKTLTDEIPPIIMAKTLVEIPSDEIGNALARIEDMGIGKASSPEGVKITFDKGWVVIIPDTKKDVLKVVSEGASAEFARELCDFCVDKLMGNE